MAKKLSEAGKQKAGIHPEVLRSLIKQCDELKAESAEVNGELGAAVKNAEEAHGVHRKAFKLALSLNRMEPAVRSDFLRSLDDYREKLGFNDQADMFDGKSDEGGDEALRRLQQGEQAAADDQAAENAAALKKGIKQKPAGDAPGATAH